jgi:hypothetical protein
MNEHGKPNRDQDEKPDAPIRFPDAEPDLPRPGRGTEIYAEEFRDVFREPDLPDSGHGAEEE